MDSTVRPATARGQRNSRSPWGCDILEARPLTGCVHRYMNQIGKYETPSHPGSMCIREGTVTVDENMRDYRRHLVEAEERSQAQFDKTVLTLSGGALAVSFTFLKDIAGPAPQQTGWLIGAWIAWTVSSVCVLIAFYFSRWAIRKTIKQVDRNRVHGELPGGAWTILTESFNAVGALSFAVGVSAIIVFVKLNL